MKCIGLYRFAWDIARKSSVEMWDKANRDLEIDEKTYFDLDSL